MILCIGEILADLIGIDKNGTMTYNRYAGGAPFNVACDIKKQNCEVGFIGSVGSDLIGDFLIDYANNKGFKYLSLKKDLNRNTTLAFVELDSEGERKFSFYRKNTADYHISYDEIKNSISKADIIHIGSLMISEPDGREFADYVFEISKELKKPVSFDINFRDDIFKNRKEAVEIYTKYIKMADILKFSEEEVEIFSKSGNLNDIIDEHQLVFVTLGKKGSMCQYKNKNYFCDSISVTPKDTTGAGDAFYAGVLSCISKFNSLSDIEDFVPILKYGNICGAITTTNYGAIDACPNESQVVDILSR